MELNLSKHIERFSAAPIHRSPHLGSSSLRSQRRAAELRRSRLRGVQFLPVRRRVKTCLVLCVLTGNCWILKCLRVLVNIFLHSLVPFLFHISAFYRKFVRYSEKYSIRFCVRYRCSFTVNNCLTHTVFLNKLLPCCALLWINAFLLLLTATYVIINHLNVTDSFLC